METVVRNVRDLDKSDRSVLERVVGHELGEGQQVVIQVMSVPAGQPDVDLHAPSGELPAWCRVYEGLTDAEIDELDRAIVRDHTSREVD